jgi:hypothetical protein
LLLARLTLLAALLPAVAFAQRDTTSEALSRMEETLTLRVEEGGLSLNELTPAIVVSVAPAFEETRAWYPTAAIQALGRVFGTSRLRACEACMAPRVFAGQGRLEELSTSLGAADIIRQDETSRGTSAPAKVAIWLDETVEGVSLRVIELRNSRILMAENFDPGLIENARTRTNVAMARELERRARGDSITHAFLDVTMYPGQHISLDWAEQWGDSNANLSGVSLSLYDPVLGVGGCYYRVVPSAFNLAVGGKILMSVPTALIDGISRQQTRVFDPLLTGVFVMRVPIGRSNFGMNFTASTNGQVGFGFSLLNTSPLPFLP